VPAEVFSIGLPIAIILLGVAIGVVLRALIHAYVKRHAADPTRVDVAAFRLARGFVLIWMVLAAVAIVAGIVPLSALVRDWLDRIILALAYGTITAFLIAATVRLMRRMGERLESFRPVEGMAKRVTQITLGVIGGLLILNALTIPITPLLTTLGVAGLATALALQDTLSNFFAGFYLLADRPIRAGDFIKTSTGFSTGGATVDDISLMRGVVGQRAGVKASGGIRSLADASAMLHAGASRIGASASVKILAELSGKAVPAAPAGY